MKKAYIIGSRIKYNDKANDKKFAKFADDLIKKGYLVFDNTFVPRYEEMLEQNDMLHICYAMIDICDEIFVLPDYTESQESLKEENYAREWRKELIYV